MPKNGGIYGENRERKAIIIANAKTTGHSLETSQVYLTSQGLFSLSLSVLVLK